MAYSKPRESEDQFDLFLSYCRRDTEKFTANLRKHLKNHILHVFKDDDEIEEGDSISEKIVQGIYNSKIYMPVFSPNYPHRKWCLIELAHMMKNVYLSNGKKKILPIFWGIKPSDVRNWIPHLKTIPSEAELMEFQKAIANAGGIKGWKAKVKKTKSREELFDKIVQKVLEVLGRKEESQTDTIKLDDFTQAFENLLHKAKECTGRGSPSKITLDIGKMEKLSMKDGSISRAEITGITSIDSLEGLHMEYIKARKE